MVKLTKIGQNFTLMAITFDSVIQLQYELHFLKTLIIILANDISLPGFAEVQIYPLFLVIMSLSRQRPDF